MTSTQANIKLGSLLGPRVREDDIGGVAIVYSKTNTGFLNDVEKENVFLVVCHFCRRPKFYL